jgi:hypothetical protein
VGEVQELGQKAVGEVQVSLDYHVIDGVEVGGSVVSLEGIAWRLAPAILENMMWTKAQKAIRIMASLYVFSHILLNPKI